jgi:hypothetical protein
MQNELKTAIRFDDFYAVFGPQGVVAMAWWLGAQHAEQIRAEQQSFPLLHIEGAPGSGKTFLQSYLWKLLGEDSFSACNPEHASRNGRLRQIANAGKKVITFDWEPNEAQTDFDWNELASLYSSGHAVYGAGKEIQVITFDGAVMICSGQPIPCSDAIESRIVRVALTAPHTTESRYHAQALHQLTAAQAGAFGLALGQRVNQSIRIVNKLAPANTADLLDQHDDQLTPRSAKNAGQLMALVEVLSYLLDLSSEQRRRALSEVKYCVCAEFVPY